MRLLLLRPLQLRLLLPQRLPPHVRLRLLLPQRLPPHVRPPRLQRLLQLYALQLVHAGAVSQRRSCTLQI